MPLLVCTAHLSPRLTDPDALDVTRATADERLVRRGATDGGKPGGVDTARRLRQLGNAVVPQVAEVVGHVVLEILGRHHVQP